MTKVFWQHVTKSSMADIIDRIDKLIALALNNPNEEESRSAALAAVKAIREHKIRLSAEKTPSKPTVFDVLERQAAAMRDDLRNMDRQQQSQYAYSQHFADFLNNYKR